MASEAASQRRIGRILHTLRPRTADLHVRVEQLTAARSSANHLNPNSIRQRILDAMVACGCEPIDGLGQPNSGRMGSSSSTGPVPVDAAGRPLPAVLASLRQAMQAAAVGGDYQLAMGLSDLLFVIEPRPEMTVAECNPPSLEGKADFFVKHGFVVVGPVRVCARARACASVFVSSCLSVSDCAF